MTATVSPFGESPCTAQRWRTALALASAMMLGACSSLGASGPSSSAVKNAQSRSYAEGQVQIVNLDDSAVRRIAAFSENRSFAKVFGESPPAETLIGAGDIVDVAIWEAPPAVLFGVTTSDVRLAANPLVAQSASIPQQMVDENGMIFVPFAGKIRAAGRSTGDVQREIVGRLRGKAHEPQVVVRLAQNEARNVTVIGEATQSKRVPLTAKGERLLDVLAAAGGAKHPVDKTTLQLSRGATVATMPLDVVARDPSQNVRVRPDDVVTVLFQPYSFIALGAVTQNAEIPFEGSGLSLAQALGRVGGLRDERANIRGVFVFRMEDPAALDPAVATSARKTADGKIPVIYRLDLSDATSFFAARDFAVRDDDILYVSNAPGVDLQKFLTTLSNVAFSAIAISNSVK